MLNFSEELNIFAKGYNIVGGIDEAGRGPLAGPVVAACVVAQPGIEASMEELAIIKDSKKMTEKRREKAFDLIYEFFPEVGIGICDHKTVDRINILEASFLAMKKAVGSLKQKPDFIIVDGKFEIPNFSTKQKALKKGDSFVLSIAAASVVAKVTRDRMMLEMHAKYPDYGFAQHKGYGTKLHMKSLRKHGPCPIHRTSFRPVKELL